MQFKRGENRIFLEDKSQKTYAEITYTTVSEGLFIINNTYVHPDYQGQGIAKKLVEAVVVKARDEDKKIVPACPFANAEFERRIDYADVKK